MKGFQPNTKEDLGITLPSQLKKKGGGGGGGRSAAPV